MNHRHSVNNGGRRWIRALLAAAAVCVLGALTAAVLLGTCADDGEPTTIPAAIETTSNPADQADGMLALPEEPQTPEIPVALSFGISGASGEESVSRAPIEIEVIHSGEMVGERYPGSFTAIVTGEPESFVTLTADYSFSNEKTVYDLVLDAAGCASADFSIASDGRVSLNAVYSRGEPNAAQTVSFKVDGKAPPLFAGEAVAGDALLTGISEAGAYVVLTAPGVFMESVADQQGAYAFSGHVFAVGVEYTITARDAIGNTAQVHFVPEKAAPVFDAARSVEVSGVEAVGTSGENDMITLEVRGVAEPGCSVDVFINGVYCMRVSADGDGMWSAVIIAPVSDAGYDVRAMYAE